jgi:urease accessory protein
MGKSRFASLLFRALLLPILVTGQAMAHHEPPGMEEVDEFAGEPFTAALTHPFSGADHWLAALAVGLLVWSWGRRTGMLAGTVFVLAMLGGMVAGRECGPIPLMESGLAVSVILAGAVVAGPRWFSRRTALAVSAATGLWHGLAHGMEMPGAAPAGAYTLGLVLGSGFIVLLAGLSVARLPAHRPEWPRWAGGSLAAAGTWLLLAGIAS